MASAFPSEGPMPYMSHGHEATTRRYASAPPGGHGYVDIDQPRDDSLRLLRTSSQPGVPLRLPPWTQSQPQGEQQLPPPLPPHSLSNGSYVPHNPHGPSPRGQQQQQHTTAALYNQPAPPPPSHHAQFAPSQLPGPGRQVFFPSGQTTPTYPQMPAGPNKAGDPRLHLSLPNGQLPPPMAHSLAAGSSQAMAQQPMAMAPTNLCLAMGCKKPVAFGQRLCAVHGTYRVDRAGPHSQEHISNEQQTQPVVRSLLRPGSTEPPPALPPQNVSSPGVHRQVRVHMRTPSEMHHSLSSPSIATEYSASPSTSFPPPPRARTTHSTHDQPRHAPLEGRRKSTGMLVESTVGRAGEQAIHVSHEDSDSGVEDLASTPRSEEAHTPRDPVRRVSGRGGEPRGSNSQCYRVTVEVELRAEDACLSFPSVPELTKLPLHLTDRQLRALWKALPSGLPDWEGGVGAVGEVAATDRAGSVPRRASTDSLSETREAGEEGEAGEGERKAESVKKGRQIDQHHEQFELTSDMMMGIRTNVSKTEAKEMRSLKPRHFTEVKKMKFPKRGSSMTPAHNMHDFYFKDYAPEVFRRIRARFGLDPSDYMLSVCGNAKYLEFKSNSKSGEFFFFSHKKDYMIKTISHSEAKFLIQILPEYYRHIMLYRDTLLSRFYGLHKVKMEHKRDVYFLIMGSIFADALKLHLKFDLKGSALGRSASDEDKKNPDSCVFKDNDLLSMNMKVRLAKTRRNIFNEQITLDTQLLYKLNIMDYSLLLGVHDVERGRQEAQQAGLPPAVPAPGAPAELSLQTPGAKSKHGLVTSRSAYLSPQPTHQRTASDSQIGKLLPTDVARGSIFESEYGGIMSEDGRHIYYMGLIDFLIEYGAKKRMETFIKSARFDVATLSAVKPDMYAMRFRKFMAHASNYEVNEDTNAALKAAVAAARTVDVAAALPLARGEGQTEDNGEQSPRSMQRPLPHLTRLN